MPVLAIDTAMNACSAAVGGGAAVLASRVEAMRQGQAERLLPMVEEVMAEAGARYDAIALIAVTVGPGTFTGVRIGVAAARGLSLATGAPVLALTSLEGIAAAAVSVPTAKPLVIVSDARRGEVYHQSFDCSGAIPLATSEVQLTALDDLAAQLPAEPFLAAGSAAALIASAQGVCDILEDAPDDPVAARLLPLAAARAGEARPGPQVAPLYLRAPDAKLPGSGA